MKDCEDRPLAVVVVDDEVPIREELEGFDWESVGAVLAGSAADGQQALELIRRLRPDLVITDIIMPIMDGIELLTELRREMPELQVVMLTVSKDFESARTALRLGALDYLIKVSLDPGDIAGAVEKARRRLREIGAWSHSLEAQAREERERPELREARRIIAEEYMRPIGLAYVADRVCLSPSYLSYLFSTLVGETFNDYLSRTRIEQAVELLKSTSLKVYEVSERVGIPNYRYFSEVFRKRTGKRPKDFQCGAGVNR